MTTALGRLIRAQRTELGLTQVQVSERSGLAQEHISKLERGAIEQPDRATLDGLAVALSLRVERLMIAAYGKETDDEDVTTVDVLGEAPGTRFGQELRSVTIARSAVSRARYPVFAVEVQDDALADYAPAVVTGDTVILEEYHGQDITEGKIVFVCIAEHYRLALWHVREDGQVELRNGAGRVVHVQDGRADALVLGIALHRIRVNESQL